MLLAPIVSALGLERGEQVIAIVNGLGSTHLLELSLMFEETAELLAATGVAVARSLVGSYVTSLDMAGCSITLVRADARSARALGRSRADARACAGSPVAELLDADAVRAWIGDFAVAFRTARGELDELDRQSGDGDFGSNLLGAIDRIEGELEGAPDAAAGEVFATVSKRIHARRRHQRSAVRGLVSRVRARERRRQAGWTRRRSHLRCRGGLAAVAALGRRATR